MTTINRATFLGVKIVFALLSLLACCEQQENLLNLNKFNSKMEFVLSQYQQNPSDSLKLFSVHFLIANMPAHFYRSEKLELQSAIDSLNSTYDHKIRNDFDAYRAKYDSLEANIRCSESQVFEDDKTLDADFLIYHIDSIFAAFEKSPWNKYLSFSKFCELLLPYSIGNEKRELWIGEYRKHYERYRTDVFKKYEGGEISLSEVFNQIRVTLDHEREIARLYPDFDWLKNYSPTVLCNLVYGSCENNAFHLAYILRSAGIPVTLDHAPQWGAYSMGHIWNVIPDESGKMIPCDRETDMGTWKIDERIDLPKAYRYVWATDSERETTVKNAKNFVPELFRKNLRDVTAEYVPVSNITTKAKSDLSYLCVFDNVNWKPIAMAKKHWSKAVFRDMGRKTVYLPARYKGDELFSSSFPLLLDSAGLTHTLEPDLKNKQTMLLTRKFHSRRIGFYYNRMINGKFQGANHADFNDATNLYEITEIPPLSFSTIELPEKKEFRYFRYIGAKGSFCNVAEITVHYDNGEKMTGKVIGTQSSSDFFDRGKEKESAFDGDGLTYFKSATDSGGWVGLDFGQPQSIAKIRFMPRNDDNNIRNGDEYELFYWSKTGWQSLGVQTGTESGELIYDNCPTNALFWLRNHTRGKEERIFTYENGKQVFW